MSKIILTFVLLVSINLATIKKSNAAIAGIVSLAGPTSAAGVIAYIGLGSIASGLVIDLSSDDGEYNGIVFAIFTGLGLIILEDSGSAQLQINNLSIEELSEKGLTPAEVASVLNNQEELEAVFNDSMNSDQTVEQASARWEIARDIYGADAVSGFYKTLSNE